MAIATDRKADAMPEQLTYSDSTRGMRGAVHVLITTADGSPVVDTRKVAGAFETAAAARAYAMRWKTAGRRHGETYVVRFAAAD